MLEEIFYFSEDTQEQEEEEEEGEEGKRERKEPLLEAFNDETLESLFTGESVALMIKARSGHEVESILDEVLRLVYGELMKPPGSEESPAQLLRKVEEDEDTGQTLDLTGIWAPPNYCMTAACLKVFFPRAALSYAIPEPPPTPPHYAIIFGLTKFPEALEVISKYPKDVMNYGFFTSEIPEEATLIAKTYHKLERSDKRNFKEKLVIKVSSKKSELMFALAQLEPLHISPNTDVGEKECELFFPEEAEIVDEEVHEEEEGGEEGAEMTDMTDMTGGMGEGMGEGIGEDLEGLEEGEDEFEEEYVEGEQTEGETEEEGLTETEMSPEIQPTEAPLEPEILEAQPLAPVEE